MGSPAHDGDDLLVSEFLRNQLRFQNRIEIIGKRCDRRVWVGEGDVAVGADEVEGVFAEAGGGGCGGPGEGVEREVALVAEFGDAGIALAVDVDLPVDGGERGEVVGGVWCFWIRRDPGEAVAGFQVVGFALAERAVAVVDADLGDGAEHVGGGWLVKSKTRGRTRGDDVEADEAGEAAGAGGERECAVGGFDEAAGEGDAFGFVGVEQFCGGAVVEDVGQFPGEIHGVADAGVHALAADGAVDVGGVAEEEHAAFVEVLGDAVVDVVGAEPVYFVDVDAEAVDGGGADVVPGEAAGFVGELRCGWCR